MGLELVKRTVELDQWAELHPDLLNEILRRVYSYDDYVRLRAVCKPWNLELPKTPKHIRSPWLVLPFDGETFETEEKEAYHLRLPEMKNTMLRGSCFGWLISVGSDDVLRLSNPFTKAHYDLPPMSTFPNVVAYQPDKQDEEYTIRYIRNGKTYPIESTHMQKSQVQKVILSSSPDHDKQDFMAVTIYGDCSRLAFYRFGDNKWTDVPTAELDCGYEDVIFHGGKIYAIDMIARLYEFDMKTPFGGISEVPPPHDLFIPYANMNNKYLVWNPDGDLLMAIRHLNFYPKHKIRNGEEVESCYRTSRFDIYKLNKSAKQWSRVFSLGNYVLVVGFNSSVWIPPFSDGKVNWVRNCIYYTDNMLESQYPQVIGGHDIGVFNLEDGSINQLFSNSDFLCPPPVWLLVP